MLQTPVLFLIFNRPDTTAKVFEAIRNAKPKQLFIAADGPRIGNEADVEKCKQAREVVKDINWSCEIKTLFREKNLGCKYAVSSAINWFFEQVEEGIILEDDTLPNASFFDYCEELLKIYRHIPEIMHISGTNFQFGRKRGRSSYYFSRYFHIWGWATWKRAWRLYDLDMRLLDKQIIKDKMFSRLSTVDEQRYWAKVFEDVKCGNVNTWDYQWLFSIWSNNGICVTPNINFISNIGFGEDATHTVGNNSRIANLQQEELHELIHPEELNVNYRADEFTFRQAVHVKLSCHLKLKNYMIRFIPESVKVMVKMKFMHLVAYITDHQCHPFCISLG